MVHMLFVQNKSSGNLYGCQSIQCVRLMGVFIGEHNFKTVINKSCCQG